MNFSHLPNFIQIGESICFWDCCLKKTNSLGTESTAVGQLQAIELWFSRPCCSDWYLHAKASRCVTRCACQMEPAYQHSCQIHGSWSAYTLKRAWSSDVWLVFLLPKYLRTLMFVLLTESISLCLQQPTAGLLVTIMPPAQTGYRN